VPEWREEMAFPASTQVKVDALQKVRRTANQLKSSMQTKNDTMESKSVSGAFILSILGETKAAIAVFDEVAAVSGIVVYVQGQYDDDQIDVAAEFSAMKTAAENVRDWIIANLPQSGGYLAIRTMDANGVIADRMFAPAATAGLRTQIDSLIATIG